MTQRAIEFHPGRKPPLSSWPAQEPPSHPTHPSCGAWFFACALSRKVLFAAAARRMLRSMALRRRCLLALATLCTADIAGAIEWSSSTSSSSTPDLLHTAAVGDIITVSSHFHGPHSLTPEKASCLASVTAAGSSSSRRGWHGSCLLLVPLYCYKHSSSLDSYVWTIYSS